jgi:YggT family protein
VDPVSIILLALDIYWFAVLAWVILSWIPVSPGHPLGKVSLFLDRIIYPVILPLRRVIRPVRLGAGMLDLTPIILLIGLNILRRVVAGIG